MTRKFIALFFALALSGCESMTPAQRQAVADSAATVGAVAGQIIATWPQEGKNVVLTPAQQQAIATSVSLAGQLAGHIIAPSPQNNPTPGPQKVQRRKTKRVN